MLRRAFHDAGTMKTNPMIGLTLLNGDTLQTATPRNKICLCPGRIGGYESSTERETRRS